MQNQNFFCVYRFNPAKSLFVYISKVLSFVGIFRKLQNVPGACSNACNNTLFRTEVRGPKQGILAR